MSKGSKRRPGSEEAYREGWEKIWGKVRKEKAKAKEEVVWEESTRTWVPKKVQP